MIFGKRTRTLSVPQRRRNLQHQLRLEHLEHRIVFAGLSPIAVNDLYHAVSDQTLDVATSGVLANDSDAEGDALQALEFRGPAHGSLELNPDGSFSYTPESGFSGTDGFIYQVDDGESRSHLAAVTIRVVDANSAPQGQADSYIASEDVLLSIGATHGVLANDTDVDGDPLEAILGEGPSHGTLNLNADGSFSYQPNENFNGFDSFTYQVSDGSESSDLIMVELTVEAVNDAPIGANDQYSTNEDEPLTIVTDLGVLANDSDVDNDPLQAILDVGPEHGTLEFNSDGSFTYTPDENYFGPDAFTYQVSDGTELSQLIVVELMVNAVNDLPVGQNDEYATNEDEPLTIATEAGVLANDSDVDGDPLQAILDVGPEHGTLELNPDGSFTYTPNENYNGPDAFTYAVSDGTDSSELVVVELMVNAVNDLPVGQNDEYTTSEDEPLTIASEAGVLANDSDVDNDPLQAILDVGPEHGTLELNPDGSFTYTPNANYNGPDAFTYAVSDGTDTSDLVVVELMVNAVNDLPVGQNDAYATNEDEPLTIATEAGVLANDSDVDGDPLQAILEVGPEHGTLELNSDGSFIYTPNENYNGPDAFTYAISDGTDTSDLVVVELMVNAVNDLPVGQNDEYATNEDEPLTIATEAGVLGNDSDVDGDPLQAILEVGPEHGTLELNTDGSFTYTPNENYNGPDAFTYAVSDGIDTSDLVVVELMVNAVNDDPLAADDSYATDKNETLTVASPGVLSNDSDGDGDGLTAILVDAPTHGTVELAEDGSFVYKPAEGFSGQDEFTYRASDGSASTLAVVSILIRGENIRPRAVNDAYRLEAGSELTVDAEHGVLANDSDANDDPLQAFLFRGPQHGTLALNPDGSFNYTPAEGFSGQDSFLYRASDGASRSKLAVVSLRVRAAEAPQANSAASSLALTDGLPRIASEASNSAREAHDAVMSAMGIENFLLTEFDDLLTSS